MNNNNGKYDWNRCDIESIRYIIQGDNGPTIRSIGINVPNKVLRIEIEFEYGKKYCCNEVGCHYGFTLNKTACGKIMEMLTYEIGYCVNSIVMIFIIARGSITLNPNVIVANHESRYAKTIRGLP